jgi:hypothetical protein
LDIQKDPNVIQINDLQKIKGLELQDRYNVMETLLRELVEVRQEERATEKAQQPIQELMM